MDTLCNVYTDPDKERRMALQLPFPKINTENASPGVTYAVTPMPTSESFMKIMAYFKDKGMFVQVTSHVYRLATEDAFYDSYIHTDAADYQVIISLSPCHDGHDGHDGRDDTETEHYYRHRASGLSRIDYKRLTFDSDYSIHASEIKHDCNASFDIIATERLEYNKAIFIECDRFHAPSKGLFGHSRESARLIEIYTISIVSMSVVEKYPFVWHYKNVLPSEICDELIQHIQGDLIDPSAHAKKGYTHQIQAYRDEYLHKVLKTYITHITSHVDEFKQLMNFRKTKLKLNIEYAYEYFPNLTGNAWDFNLSSQYAAFQFMFNLNDNQTGIQLVSHFDDDAHVLPCCRGSLIIYPYSWMYPFRQPRIFNGDKYLIRGIISFI